ncbi:MAG TPA: undecaprenyl-diphosphatase UppP [Candidatus Bipolaricaulota bacterium]|nr:undecaprenyl-diphosphatase UppP [Candidatus Bipolaricaulota bacterium]
MIYLSSLFLGIVQGITEFLPVSSSGHLIIFRDILNFQINDSLSFDVALHLGTLLAIIVYFAKPIGVLCVAWFSSFKKLNHLNDDQRLAWLLVLGSIPAALLGAAFGDFFEKVVRNSVVVIVALILGGVLFLLVEKFYKGNKQIISLNWKSALAIGFAQAIALIPGVSRSGITIITGMGFKLQRGEAARFSFVLGIPVMLGAAVLGALKLNFETLTSEAPLFIIGIISSAVIGFVAIKFLLAILNKRGMRPFAYYRFLLAAALIVYLLLN